MVNYGLTPKHQAHRVNLAIDKQCSTFKFSLLRAGSWLYSQILYKLKKNLPRTNALAYLPTAHVTKKASFIMLTPGCPFGLCRRLPERGCLVRHGHQVSGSFIDTYGSVGFQQGSLTEGEGSVRLTSLY